MLFTTLFALLVLANCLAPIESAKRRFDLEVSSLICSKYSTRVKRYDCDLKKLAISRFAIDSNFVLDPELDKDAEVRVIIDVNYAEGRIALRFVDLKLKICDALSQVLTMPLTRELFAEARRTGNLPYSCPLQGNFLYNLANYSLTAESIPAYAPPIHFNFSMSFYENQKLFAEAKLQGYTFAKS